jgi:hypothetical protein
VRLLLLLLHQSEKNKIETTTHSVRRKARIQPIYKKDYKLNYCIKKTDP